MARRARDRRRAGRLGVADRDRPGRRADARPGAARAAGRRRAVGAAALSWRAGGERRRPDRRRPGHQRHPHGRVRPRPAAAGRRLPAGRRQRTRSRAGSRRTPTRRCASVAGVAGRGGRGRRRRPRSRRSASTTRARRSSPGTPRASRRWRRRSSGAAAARSRSSTGWRRPGDGAEVERIAGLPLDPYFSSTKIRWLIENVPQVATAADEGRRVRHARRVPVAPGSATAPAPSRRRPRRTQLQALAAPGRWDPELLPISRRRRRLAAADRRVDRRLRGRSPACRCAAMLVDQTAALAGHGCLGRARPRPRTAPASSCCRTPARSRRPSWRACCRSWPGRTAARPPTRSTAASSRPAPWSTGCATARAHRDARRDRGAGASRCPTPAACAFLPALAGLGAPWWRSDARAAFAGMTAGTTRAHLVRAALDSLASACATSSRRCRPRPPDAARRRRPDRERAT